MQQNIHYILVEGNYISRVEDEIFGSFVEHLGRAVYTGIYEPGHPTADKNGCRQDVAQLIKQLGISTVRYPGGNFVSGYNWRDGVGPKSERPVRLDYAWLSTETNEFGIDEFYTWCQTYDLRPMTAVNLGTGTPQEAGYFIEYCNIKSGTAMSDLRRRHGREEPYNFKLWCLGNEMDGPWQTCHLDAEDYVKKARETAKIMRWVDPEVKLVGCGSATTALPSYPEWDRVVLEGLYDHIDFLSCHHYFENTTGKITDFLASGVLMNDFIHTITATADFVRTKLRSHKTMMISFDEYNIWSNIAEPWTNYFDEDPGRRFTRHPPLLEQIYTLADALAFSGLLITLLNNCDRVKMASLAQLVNVIAPIFTKEGGGVICQSIFHPFYYVSRYGRGQALQLPARVPMLDTVHGDAKMLQSAAVFNAERGELALFVLNISDQDEAVIDCTFDGFAEPQLQLHQVLSGPDLNAVNSFEHPDAVTMRPQEITPAGRDGLQIKVAPLSFNVLVFKTHAL